MSEERREAPADEGEARVKVTDRRRFTAEGEPLGAEGLQGEGLTPEDVPARAEVGRDERDQRISEQAARIEELSRAYAALLEDNRAFRQRQERERVRVVESERALVAQALLEAADDLERALGAVSGAGEGGEALRGLVDGVRISLGGLHKRITEIGAVRLAVVGKPFDPYLAEAVDTVAVARVEQDGLVVEEVRPGWKIGDRVLRPARVRVGRIARA